MPALQICGVGDLACRPATFVRRSRDPHPSKKRVTGLHRLYPTRAENFRSDALTLLTFSVPAGVRGGEPGSGGPNWTLGAMTFLPLGDDGSWPEACHPTIEPRANPPSGKVVVGRSSSGF
jgi:hypothetical protein